MKYSQRFPHIASVGVELEGGITATELHQLEALYALSGRFSWSYDGSVRVSRPPGAVRWIENVELKYWSDDLDDVLEFVQECFARGFRQNRTCGNHHHFKFTSHRLACTALATRVAYRNFIAMYKDFAQQMKKKKYMMRLGNTYCKAPDSDYDFYNAIVAYNRYYAINFCALFKHGTLEIRILPYARDFEEYKTMHLWLCEAVNTLIDRALKNIDKLVTLEVSL